MKLSLRLIDCIFLICCRLLPSIFYGISAKEFLNEWLVEVPGGLEQAQLVATDHGYQLVKEVSSTAERERDEFRLFLQVEKNS